MKALAFSSTWGLGGICLVLVAALASSGALMLFAYQPFAELAYDSVLHLQGAFLFGQMTRNIHYFSANLLVVVLFCHMLRVFFTGGYTGVRQINWMIGVCIFGLLLFSCFTGYLLPWDQTAFWAVTICINMFDYIPGGSFFKGFITNEPGVSQHTLQVFFTLHTTIIPIVLMGFLATHFWKIRRAKGVVTAGGNPVLDREKSTHETSTSPKPVMVKTNPDLLLREAVVALVIIALLLVISVFSNAPLGEMANAGLSPNPAKAPWYFAGLQELFLHFHPFFAVFVIPGVGVLTLLFFPFILRRTNGAGVWFISARAKKAGKRCVFLSVVLTLSLILMDEYLLDFNGLFPGLPQMISIGLIPVALVSGLVFLCIYRLKKKYELRGNEVFQTLAVFVLTAFIVLTLTGVWFRGSGMKLGGAW